MAHVPKATHCMFVGLSKMASLCHNSVILQMCGRLFFFVSLYLFHFVSRDQREIYVANAVPFFALTRTLSSGASLFSQTLNLFIYFFKIVQ